MAQEDSGYAYALGLASGLHGRLIKPRDFEAMMQAATPTDAVALLESTDYGPRMRRLTAASRLIDLEDAIASALKSSVEELVGSVPEKDRGALAAHVYGRWDMDNLKTLTRGLRSALPPERVMPLLFPTGLIGPEELRSCSEAKTPEELSQKLKQPYRDIASEAASKWSSPLEYEEELDRRFIRRLASESGGSMAEQAGMLADTLNIRTTLRCIGSGISASAHMLDGGLYVNDARLRQMGGQDRQGVFRLLADTPYAEAVGKALQPGGVPLSAGLREAVDEQTRYRSLLCPLSVDTVISFIRAKEREAYALRAILAGKWHGLTAEALKAVVS